MRRVSTPAASISGTGRDRPRFRGCRGQESAFRDSCPAGICRASSRSELATSSPTARECGGRRSHASGRRFSLPLPSPPWRCSSRAGSTRGGSPTTRCLRAECAARPGRRAARPRLPPTCTRAGSPSSTPVCSGSSARTSLAPRASLPGVHRLASLPVLHRPPLHEPGVGCTDDGSRRRLGAPDLPRPRALLVPALLRRLRDSGASPLPGDWSRAMAARRRGGRRAIDRVQDRRRLLRRRGGARAPVPRAAGPTPGRAAATPSRRRARRRCRAGRSRTLRRRPPIASGRRGELTILVAPVLAVVAVAVVGQFRALGGVPTASIARSLGRLRRGRGRPLALVVAPYLVTGSLGALQDGILVSPQSRLDYAYRSTPGPILLLCAAPLVAGLGVRGSVPARARNLIDAGLVALVAILLVTSTSTVSYLLLWNSARAFGPVVVVAGAVALLATRGRQDLREPLFLLLAVTAMTGLVQFPFGAPVYYAYVAPLVALTAVAVASFAGIARGAAPVAVAVAFLVFALVVLDQARSTRSRTRPIATGRRWCSTRREPRSASRRSSTRSTRGSCRCCTGTATGSSRTPVPISPRSTTWPTSAIRRGHSSTSSTRRARRAARACSRHLRAATCRRW